MSLNAVTDPKQIAAAFARFSRHFETGGECFERSIVSQAGNEPAQIRWFSDLNIWVLLQPTGLSRYGCAFGVDDPREAGAVAITVEINPPREGVDRTCAGVFVRSNHGATYLAHSGRIGGGRPGVGKDAFLKFYGDETLDAVEWPDGKVLNYLVISALDDSEFRSLVAEFVHKVARFKTPALASKSS